MDVKITPEMRRTIRERLAEIVRAGVLVSSAMGGLPQAKSRNTLMAEINEKGKEVQRIFYSHQEGHYIEADLKDDQGNKYRLQIRLIERTK
jgi:hypothetical protein